MVDFLFGISLPGFTKNWAFNWRYTCNTKTIGMGLRLCGIYVGFRFVWRQK